MSPFFDYSSKKIKFKADNFSDMALKSYISDMEERFLLNQRKVNKSCQRFVFTSLFGPAFDFMKKLFANFGFPNQYYADLPTPQAGIDFPGVPMPSVSKLGLLALR
jgi:phosphomannomutase